MVVSIFKFWVEVCLREAEWFDFAALETFLELAGWLPFDITRYLIKLCSQVHLSRQLRRSLQLCLSFERSLPERLGKGEDLGTIASSRVAKTTERANQQCRNSPSNMDFGRWGSHKHRFLVRCNG